MIWQTTVPELEQCVLFQVDIYNSEGQFVMAETRIGFCDPDGDMVCLRYREDIGWRAENVSQWVDLDNLLSNITTP